jgi:hypothetical protein
MNRRSLLKGIAASVLKSFSWRGSLLQVGRRRSVANRVRPSDPLWPSDADWGKLRAAVGGNLIKAHPLFGVCEDVQQSASCLDAKRSMRNPFSIGDHPSGTQVSGWLDAWTPARSKTRAGSSLKYCKAGLTLPREVPCRFPQSLNRTVGCL